MTRCVQPTTGGLVAADPLHAADDRGAWLPMTRCMQPMTGNLIPDDPLRGVEGRGGGSQAEIALNYRQIFLRGSLRVVHRG
jgi:hypothetical protein